MTQNEPWSPVSVGVDVTKEGTHVIAMRLRPNGVNQVIYSQFHPLAQPKQPKVRTGDCLLVGVCASEGHKIQPQRTWVGLTDEDLPALAGDNGKVMELQQVRRFAKVIEAKIKEKNT